MSSQSLPRFESPIHLSWFCYQLSKNPSHDAAVQVATAVQSTISPYSGFVLHGLFGDVRRLGLTSIIARAYVRAQGVCQGVIKCAAIVQISAEINDSYTNPPNCYVNQASQLARNEAFGYIADEHINQEILNSVRSFNQGYFGYEHPYPGGTDISEEEWQGGDCWHWLWVLTQSSGRPEQGISAYRRLRADPVCWEEAKKAGLLPAIAFNLCEALIPPDQLEGKHRVETCRFPALYAAVRLAFLYETHEQVCENLRYPNPNYPNHPAIIQTLELMQNWF